ncbi:hypothetical protein H632_c188p0 [Helicosporidium sp. ATCC 50920]|nr:hypothetical protein H632_c188p0 [Helicosporidium sp. ATCC 50920]|eukprot:KDD76542.1 hypothetical protein H632_c188p0 [Helicosporidium sp. ATCC 50920]
MDTYLSGAVCASADQKQRTYDVKNDGDSLWISLPDESNPSLPSDVYNQVAVSTPHAFPRGSNYGLFGSAQPAATDVDMGSQEELPCEPLRQAPVPTTHGELLMLSQGSEGGSQDALSQSSDDTVTGISRESLAACGTVFGAPSLMDLMRVQKRTGEGIDLLKPSPGRSTADIPHLARRRMATAAIRNRAYAPPLVGSRPNPSQSTLFQAWGATVLMPKPV